jgi:signal transduction histidine kinase/CheY-like chemotaxis protein
VRAEEALRQLNEELEQRVTATVAEREAALTQLSQAQKMEAVGQLTGGVAHDFNNLLQVILGNLDAVRRRLQRGEAVPPLDLAQRLDTAVTSGERGARLTQQLLAFARRQPLAPKPLDANKLVGGMSDMLHRTLGETIEIETVLAAGLWPILADPNQLESAVLNLALNARDAMPKGGKLTIETANAYLDDDYASQHKEVQAGHYVLIAVSDTGTGMDKDVLGKAFEPFFTTKEMGTGLGLSQVYGFVKQSGGHVKIYSEPGEGTTVKLYLPQDLTATAVAADHPPEKTVPTGTPEDVILIVEDHAEVRANASEMLRELGYEVAEAPDGLTALRILERSPHVRLLFTDIGLPGGSNGRQLADEAIRRRPGLKVLFTTGYAYNAMVHQGRLDPDIELLPKPFTFTELAMKVRRALDR